MIPLMGNVINIIIALLCIGIICATMVADYIRPHKQFSNHILNFKASKTGLEEEQERSLYCICIVLIGWLLLPNAL